MAKRVLELGGDELFATPPEALYRRLTDLDMLATSIPDLQSSQRVDDRTLRCVVRPGVSFLRGTLKMEITITPTDPPRRAEMCVSARGIGAVMQIVSRMDLEPQDEGTRLVWTARLEKATGLVATVSPTLIQAAAQQVLRNSWSSIRQQLEQERSADPPENVP